MFQKNNDKNINNFNDEYLFYDSIESTRYAHFYDNHIMNNNDNATSVLTLALEA